jgi:uroporphyrinogen-III synthase
MRVLVTRAEGQAARTAARLRAAGHDPVLAPVLVIAATGTAWPAPLDALVLTSAQAALAMPDTAADDWRNVPAFAVGERTAQAVRERGFSRVTSAGSDAAALATLMVATLPPGASVLYAAGHDRKPVLEQALAAAGLALTVVEVYAARPAPGWDPAIFARLQGGTLDAALHYSARSAALARSQAETAGVSQAFLDLRHHCVSDDAAAPLVAAGATIVAIASHPDEDSLLATL